MERTRTKLHLKINESEKLTDSKVVKASEEMDQKVLEEMLKQDPKIENNYLKRVVKAKDIQIVDLQNELKVKEQRIKELTEIALMYYESGLPMYRVQRILDLLKLKEGLI